MQKLVLASQSPARQELVGRLGVKPILAPQDIDETPFQGELPRPHVLRLAEEKAKSARLEHDDVFILAADTIVAVGRRMLGKAKDAEEAREHLNLLSGRRHRVLTGVCLITPENKIIKKVVSTQVSFKSLTQDEMGHFIEFGDWRGKCGSYGLFASAFVKSINGSPTNVMGLPLYEVNNMLSSNGFYAS